MISIPTWSREKAKLSKSETVYYALSIVILLFSILIYTYPSIQTVHNFYAQQKMAAKQSKLKKIQNSLMLKYERLMSPYQMKARAMQNGFIEPGPNQVSYVRKIK